MEGEVSPKAQGVFQKDESNKKRTENLFRFNMEIMCK